MAIRKKAEEKEVQNYEVKVLKVKEFDNAIAFDMEVNGVTIYGCYHRTYTDKKTKEEKSFIAFPSQKSEKNGKYYSHAFFPVNDELLADIEKQIENLL